MDREAASSGSDATALLSGRVDEDFLRPAVPMRPSTSQAASHDPPPLGDLPVPDEAELGEERLGPGVQVRPALRLPVDGLLRVRLDGPATCRLDRLEHRSQRGASDVSPPSVASFARKNVART